MNGWKTFVINARIKRNINSSMEKLLDIKTLVEKNPEDVELQNLDEIKQQVDLKQQADLSSFTCHHPYEGE